MQVVATGLAISRELGYVRRGRQDAEGGGARA
jgi:hypothetical protein